MSKYDEIIASRFKKAEEVYTLIGFEGMYHDGYDGYYNDIDDYVEEGGGDGQDYLFLTKPMHPMLVDVYKGILLPIEEMANVEGFDCKEHLKGIRELIVAVETFNNLNKDVIIGWSPDYTKKIKVDYGE